MTSVFCQWSWSQGGDVSVVLFKNILWLYLLLQQCHPVLHSLQNVNVSWDNGTLFLGVPYPWRDLSVNTLPWCKGQVWKNKTKTLKCHHQHSYIGLQNHYQSLKYMLTIHTTLSIIWWGFCVICCNCNARFVLIWMAMQISHCRSYKKLWHPLCCIFLQDLFSTEPSTPTSRKTEIKEKKTVVENIVYHWVW